MTARSATSRLVLAVLDDSATGSTLLEWSGTLAQVVQGDLAVVYVESTLALRAAALPITQVLPYAGAEWSPFDAGDVERGYRVQAARLRAQAERVAQRLAVRCSVRTARGSLAPAALALADGAALVLVAPALPSPAPSRSPGPPRVLALLDHGPQAERVRQLAAEWAHRIGATCSERPVDAQGAAAALIDARADLIVMPLALADPVALSRARLPVLLVGATPDDGEAAVTDT
jgi:hypothetical protein